MDLTHTSMSNLAGFTSGSDDSRSRMGGIVTQLHRTAEFLVDIGQFDQAIACFEILSVGDDSFECGAYAYGLGRAYEGKGALADALDWYRIAYENNPPVPEYTSAVHRVIAALKNAGLAVDDHYRSGDFCYGRGQQYEGAGNLKMALVWYRAARMHNPSEGDFMRAHDRVVSKIGDQQS